MIFQLTPLRFLTVYIVQSFLIIFYLAITYKLLKKREVISRKRLIFSIYYIFSTIGLIINYIYAPIQHEIITTVLYLITIYIIYVGTSFIAIFAIAMYHEIEGNIDTIKIQITYILVLTVLYLGMFFIPRGVMISEETLWYPVVNGIFFSFCTIFINLSLIIFLIYSIKTLKIFKLRNENKILMNRWKIFIIGITETFMFASIAMLVHFLNDKPIRDIWAIVGAILMISGIYLTWFSIGKKFL